MARQKDVCEDCTFYFSHIRHNNGSHDGHVALSNNMRILERARLLRAGRRPYDATLEQCEKFNL